MNIERRIAKIEKQVNSACDREEDPLSIVDRLLQIPTAELLPGMPKLEWGTLRLYYAWTIPTYPSKG